MTLNTSERMIGDTLDVSDHVPLYGEFKAVIHRAQPDGSYLVEERPWKRNLITYKGLNRIANRVVQATGTSPAYYLGVGTITAAASLQSVNFGEVTNGRKASIVTGGSAQSREWFFLNATWAGNTDSLTGIALDSAAILDGATSGSGIVFNIVNGLAVTLQASDFLNLTARIRVGSHDDGHTT